MLVVSAFNLGGYNGRFEYGWLGAFSLSFLLVGVRGISASGICSFFEIGGGFL